MVIKKILVRRVTLVADIAKEDFFDCFKMLGLSRSITKNTIDS